MAGCTERQTNMTEKQLAKEMEVEAQEMQELAGCTKCGGQGWYPAQESEDDFVSVECQCITDLVESQN